MRQGAKSSDTDIAISAIDLFCGAGGLTRGLENAGIDVRLGIDSDPACAYPLEANNRAQFLNKPVEKLLRPHIDEVFEGASVRLLAGCAPCQPFSTYSQGRTGKHDHRWNLLSNFVSLIRRVGPELVTMENVVGLREQEIFRQFVNELGRLKYEVTVSVINCADYEVPQTRKRLVLLASRLGRPELIRGTSDTDEYFTVYDAIGKLPAIEAGEVDSRDPTHRACGLSARNLQRIRASRPGGTWRDWDADLVSSCHVRASGRKYSSIYGRMRWDEPAPTLTTQFYNYGSGRYGHPEQDRALSFREGALIQTFPCNYRFFEHEKSISRHKLGCLIGNAVPVKVGEAIGKSLISHVRTAV